MTFVMSTRRFAVIAILVAAAAFAVIAGSGINNNLVYYWTPTDLHAAGEKAFGATIRLGGMVAPGSIRRTGATGVEFDVKDAGAVVHVKSSGVPPQMFREQIGVVVEGTMTRSGAFESSRLMVSHNNQYRAPKAGHPVEKQQMEKYIREAQ
ncbi:MAG: cytochrome c-type biosis protein CcmE [Acidobacteriota bacterium]|jgi:cytochrome c-type biogenesis protein CcmE|nr:cytochrome c-type biosis protein CcmE [Acidobacteriota bacterium]